MALSIPETIERLCREMYVSKVEAVFGQTGVDSIYRIMSAARKVYAHVEPERLSGTLIIFERVAAVEKSDRTSRQPINLAGLANSSTPNIVIEIDDVGGVWRGPELRQHEVDDLARRAVVYRYSNAKEEFLAGEERMDVFKLDPAALSQFSVPSFATLREALEHYGSSSVLESTCVIFRRIWYDANRLFLKVRPEATMRESLTQFLQNRLGADYDILPEQNVDASHPVDIRVSTRLSNSRVMLIEIKWLGDSAAEDGRVTVRYRDARAQEGADQLVGYIEKQRQSTPSCVCHGYFVVIDARRSGLAEGATDIGEDEGLYYENKELEFDPAYETVRSDFEKPYRMFARPILG